MSLLEIENASVYYEDFQALYDINIKIEEGEIFACIGANGAGKSTMLKTVAGVLVPKTGRILFDGQPIDHMPPYKRVELGISSVPEGRRVFSSLSVHENLLIGAYRNRKGPWTTDAIYEMFPLLQPLRKRQANGLSGGEQQALAIGRALMANPRLILMDEVSLGAATMVGELKDGEVREYEIHPEDFGLSMVSNRGLRVGNALESKSMMLEALADRDGTPREIVVFNAGVALYAANVADSIGDGIARARSAIASGAAKRKLAEFVEVTRKLAA